MTREIDVKHLGRDRVICAYEIDGLIIDPGPASSLDGLLEGLGDTEPRGLLLTHIHLDHAGAAGTLVERFPELEVYVHDRGAPHIVDPERLLGSARQLYGADMERLWGEVLPVPEERVRPLGGGETIAGGFRVEYTPGHASHHVAYLHLDTGEAFVGDVAGVRIPPADHVIAPTPPPDIDLEAWAASLDVLEGWAPESLLLTHFGRVRDVAGHLLRMREGLARQGERGRAHGQEAFEQAVEAEMRAAADGDESITESYLQAAPPDTLYPGLERYWRKKAEREGAATGEGEGARAPATRP